ncbi:hypothetical protein IT400_00365 [Candidatus Nomurabacteria bacterium]|nr:hypothetical protein [Candidatus Nomurabacteria bacterium]
MSKINENRMCQNCKGNFVIELDDFSFYEKIKVPPPSFCPECRMIRRMSFRNERALYKIKCNLCQKNVISMYSEGKPYVIYCNECYSSDNWDALSYGVEYNLSKSFFEQYKELMAIVPRRSLYQDFAVHSEYTNQLVYVNNSYLCFGGRNYEDCVYCAQNFDLKDCVDVDFSNKCEYCYDSIHIKRSSQLFFSSYSEDCVNGWFLYGCRNCIDCIGCTNLRNKSHCILNQQYTKEEYLKIKESFNLETIEGINTFSKKFYEHSIQFPRKYAWVRNIDNSTGDDLEQVNNCHRCFSVSDSEDCRYSFFIPYGQTKNTYDVDHVGVGTMDTYELHSGFGDNRVLFGNRVYFSHDVFYSDDCYNCDNLIGCISLRKKSYCIFNKQYTKEEYQTLAPKIIEQMKNVEYLDNDKIYKFGEFFPQSMSPFAYNETVAQEYFPITEEQTIKFGYSWRVPEKKSYSITMKPENIPNINEVSDKITEEIIGCIDEGHCNHLCATAFKIIPQELLFYKRFNLPIPNKCSNCRHFERLEKINPPKLWHRKCMNDGCQNEFETSYAKDRPEIIYCEKCYQQEVL